MIERLLIANRGEIACRILRTARRLGIRGIAVFSDADANALHVREADEAVWIGPAAPRESYLNVPRILQAAKQTGADAIHPGYGFLSENPTFAQACSDAGLKFVGPPVPALTAMGSKILAKARMRAAGVPVLPGYEGAGQDLEHLAREAERLGLPLIVKPAAGGGGKGMQIVREPGQIAPALLGARRLAESAFGDGALLLERFLPSPRHVEVQIFGDSHGNLVHLGDRDCSIQRRHQKLIEEAPAPALPDEIRDRLRAAGVTVGREVGYVGAGTVEFLFDGREFYFMEMNTRLQVEHTVTEAITGLDLVEWQLRIASGEPLPLLQSQIRLAGHAMEARVCAEDPERDFLPSAGKLHVMEWPTGEGVRVDAGFVSGDRVPESYDSLLGKVIVWAPTRSAAAGRLADALERTYCAGVHTNERWLTQIIRSESFRAVAHSIAFLEREGTALRTGMSEDPADGSKDRASNPKDRGSKAKDRGSKAKDRGSNANALAGEPDLAAVALAALVAQPMQGTAGAGAVPENPWSICDGFSPNLDRPVTFALIGRDCRYAIEIGGEDPSFRRVRISRQASKSTDGKPGPAPAAAQPVELAIRDVEPTDRFISARVDERRMTARYFQRPGHLDIWLRAEHYAFLLQDPRVVALAPSTAAGGLTTPLPGVVVAVTVAPGQAVAAGEPLMVIEAMKMEHTIAAPFAGVVQSIHFAKGDRVPEGSQLLELAKHEATPPG